MKKGLLVMLLLVLFPICVNAQQKLAVFEFKPGTGVNEEDVYGVNEMFITYIFDPSKYSLVERTQLENVIREQGFQASRITESQMVRVGQILNLTHLISGSIIIVGGQYNIDVRLVDVQSGTIIATEGATWVRGTSYRSLMKRIATSLKAKLPTPKRYSRTIKSTSSNTATRTNIAGREAIDLGLSVRWATCNIGALSPEEYGNYYAWGEVSRKSKFYESNSDTDGKEMYDISGNAAYDPACANWGGAWRLPTRSEFNELINKCVWRWSNQNGIDGYKVIGPNGNSIFLPTAGSRRENSLNHSGYYGSYWSSTPQSDNTSYAYDLYFGEKDYNVHYNHRYRGRSVRPVAD